MISFHIPHKKLLAKIEQKKLLAEPLVNYIKNFYEKILISLRFDFRRDFLNCKRHKYHEEENLKHQ